MESLLWLSSTPCATLEKWPLYRIYHGLPLHLLCLLSISIRHLDTYIRRHTRLHTPNKHRIAELQTLSQDPQGITTISYPPPSQPSQCLSHTRSTRSPRTMSTLNGSRAPPVSPLTRRVTTTSQRTTPAASPGTELTGTGIRVYLRGSWIASGGTQTDVPLIRLFIPLTTMVPWIRIWR